MTPDEDERMERAERIRELRERGGGGTSNRGTDAGGETDTDGETDVGGETEVDGETNDDGGTDTGGETATVGEIATAGETDDVTESTTGDVAGTTGIALPDVAQMEAAIAGGSDDGTVVSSDADLAPGDADESTATVSDADAQEETAAALADAKRGGRTTDAYARVLVFALGEELFCIDIAGVEEIVKRETVTRVPNTPEYVTGVVDLRGQITTILDAKRLLDIEEDGPESLLVVFAPDAFDDQGAIGWIVDEVRQVRPISEDQVRTGHGDDEYVEGILDLAESDELVVWVSPDGVIQSAVGPDEESRD